MTNVSPSGDTGMVARIETRSIDYVPLHERGGKLSDQATIWFAGSAQLLSLATGAIGISMGLNLGWTLIGLALGAALGTIPVSAHATQGPHLGLPQMVQSRPQFGRYGALFIWAMALLVYWGYVVFGGNFLGATASELNLGTPPVWAIATCIVAIALAVFGYHWLHLAQRVITVALVIAIFVYLMGLTIGGFVPTSAFDLSQTFDPVSFMVVVSASTAYQLTWAFFVSDYSRYLLPTTSKPAIITFTTGGLFFGLFSFMAVGAICAALLPEEGVLTGLAVTGDYVLPGLGTVLLVTGGLGLLGLMAMCVYGGSLTLITALDSIRPVRPTRQIRVVTILLVGVTGAIAAAALPEDFLNTSFAAVLAILGYLMGPWTAVNLTDFFLVRRGRYSVREIFRTDGVYGLWNWRGILAYLISFIVMIPFMYLSFYHGPAAEAMGGVDIAFFVGIPVGGIAYWLLCRNFDLEAERRVIDEADRDLESVGRPVE